MASSKHDRRGHREILWLFAVFFLTFGPLGLYFRFRNLKEDEARRKQEEIKAEIAADRAALKFIIAQGNVNHSPWFRAIRSGPNGNGYSTESVTISLALSPNGKYLAGVLPFHSTAATPPPLSSHTPAKLVIWDADTRRQLASLPILQEAAYHLKWSGNEVITNFEDYAQSWDWKRGKLLTPPVTDDPAENEQESDVNTQASQIDVGRDIKVHMLYNGTLEAYRASTGQPLPLKVPAELKSEVLNGTQYVFLDGPANGPLLLLSSTHKDRFAPTSKGQIAPTPRPWSRDYGHIVAWDGRSGKVLWRRDFQVFFFGPWLTVSPDHTIVAALGTWRTRPGNIREGTESGIEFMDAATGKSLSSVTAQSDVSFHRGPIWLPGHILGVRDQNPDNTYCLSFYNAKTGQLQKSWPLPALASDKGPRPRSWTTPRDTPEAWTCDPTGQKWIFASSWGGWKKWTSAQIDTRVNRYLKAKAAFSPQS